MITGWLIDLGANISAWAAGLFPVWDMPTELADPGSLVSQLMAGFVGLGVWVNWVVLIGVVTAVAGTYLVLFLAKLMRAVISYIPFFGGAG